MKGIQCALAFCVLSFGLTIAEPAPKPAAKPAESTDVTRNRRSYDQWLDVISRFASRSGSGGGANNPWQPFPVDFPLPADRDGNPVSLPVLVLPVPVPVPDLRNKQECSVNSGYREPDRYQGNKISYDDISKQYQENNRFNEVNNRFRGTFESSYQEESSNAAVSTDYLIQLFREQKPRDPELPPAVIDDNVPITPYNAPHSSGSGFSRDYLPATREGPPALPVFDKSIWMRGFVTVPRSDYTEPYIVMFDADSGSSRVEYHQAGTITTRSMSSDGSRVRRSMTSFDRTGERDVTVCGVTSATRASAEDRAHPALPDLSKFTFDGYRESQGGRMEVWRMVVRGGDGELGASRGESLVFHHEFHNTRRGNFAVPMKYSVSVDSSVLGPDCDGYVHTYSEVREQRHDADIFNGGQNCDTTEQLEPSNAEHMARLEPLREFTLPSRDPRYDDSFRSFLKDFDRTYADDKETAMRKTIMVQNSRFISSCNRESGTFTTAINFLADRLGAELEQLLGVIYAEESDSDSLSFEFEERNLRSSRTSLPDEFDWRPRGGVTPVKFQGSCSTCWAFAVTGSVEGALFIRTSKLVELSEQTLVDCAHSHGAHGCKGTWPSHAYNYIKDRGQPARNEYTPYADKVLPCKAPPVPPVTHISNYVNVASNNTDALKLAIRKYAPSVVIVDGKAMSFIFYKSGVLKDHRCIKGPKNKLNHAVLAVGWGEQRKEPHFIIKNSWSAAWGDGGYIRLHAPSNTCGHLTIPSFARLRGPDVDRLPGSDSREYVDDVVARDAELR